MARILKKSLVALGVAVLLVSTTSFAGTIRVPTSGANITFTIKAAEGQSFIFDLGEAAVGGDSFKTITYTNSTSSDLTIGDLVVSENVTVRSGGCSLLKPGESCDITFSVYVAAEGANTGTVKINGFKGEAPFTDSLDFNVSGIAVSSILSVYPTKLSFSYYGEEQTITVKNTKSFPVTLSAITTGSSYWAIPSATCAGVELSAGATCTATAKYISTRPGKFSSNLKLYAGPSVYSSIPVDGSLVYGSPVFEITGVSFSGLNVNSKALRSVVVKNAGPGKLRVSGASVAGTDKVFGIDSSTCTDSLLDVNQTCNIVVSALFATANKIAQDTLTISFSNSTQSVAAIGILADSLAATKTLTATPASVAIGPVLPGDTTLVPVTLSSSGDATATVADVVVEGTNPGAISLDKSACLKAIAPGQSCKLQISLKANAEGTYSTSLRVVSDANALSVPVTTLVGSTKIAISPSTVSLSGTTATPLTQLFTITNTGAYSTSVTQLTPASPYVTISNSTCLSTLNVGQSCSFTANVASPAVGTKATNISVSYSSGAVPKSEIATITTNITAATLNLSAISCSPGVAGVAGTCSASLTNPSTATINLTGWTVANKVFGAPVVQGKSLPIAITAGQTLPVTIPYFAQPAGSYSSLVTAVNSVSNVSQTASLVVNGATPATASMTDFVCGATGIGILTKCDATLTNMSATSSLGIAGISQTNTKFVLTHTCGTSLPANGKCVVSVSITPSSTGVLKTTTTVATNPVLVKDASVSVTAPQISVTSPAEVSIPVGSSITLISSFKNSGTNPFNMANVVKAVSGTGYSLVSTTCSAALSPGQSCDVVAKFAPTGVVTKVKGFVTLSGGANAVSTMVGSTVANGLVVNRLPGVTSTIGFGALSGNVYSVTNAGATPQTLKSIVALNTNTKVVLGGSLSTPCVVGGTLLSGQSCLFTEQINVGVAPANGTVVSGGGTVTGSLTSKSWTSSYKIVTPTVAITAPVAPISNKETYNSFVTVSNSTPIALNNVSVSVTSSIAGVKLTLGSGCTQVLLPNQSCSLPLSVYSDGALNSATTSTVSAVVFGAFDSAMNGVKSTLGSPVKQANASKSFTFWAPVGSWTVGTYPIASLFSTVSAGHTFKNIGSSIINVDKVVIKDGTGTNQSLLEDACAGKSLLPGATCKVTTSFYASDKGANEPAILQLTTTTGAVFLSGAIQGIGEGVAVLDLENSKCYNTAAMTSELPITLNVDVRHSIFCDLAIKNTGSGPLGLRYSAFRVYSPPQATPPVATELGFVPVNAVKSASASNWILNGSMWLNRGTLYDGPYPTIFSRTPNMPVSDSSDKNFTWRAGYGPKLNATLVGSTPGGPSRYSDGSIVTSSGLLKLSPGKSAYFPVTLIQCPSNNVSAESSWCYKTVGGGVILEAVLFVAPNPNLSNENLIEFKALSGFKIVANVRFPIANISVPAGTIEYKTTLDPTKNSTVLQKGQSITHTFKGVPGTIAGLSYSGRDQSIDEGASTMTDLMSNGLVSYLKGPVKYANAISGKTEYVTASKISGLVTATTCVKDTPAGPNYNPIIANGDSCYVRYSCLTDPVSGVSVAGEVDTTATYSKYNSYQFDRATGIETVRGAVMDFSQYVNVYGQLTQVSYKTECQIPTVTKLK